MNNTIVYLIGHYGVGKLTIGRALCAATDARLFDNHLANNVIFSLVRENGATPLPERVWDLIGVIRDQAITAIAELARPDASFVLTNCLMEGYAIDREAYEKVQALAAQRGSLFLPVVLTASDAAHAVRIPSSERADRLKMTDVSGAALKRNATEILRIDHPNRLDIDTTDLPPSEAARIIIEHAERQT